MSDSLNTNQTAPGEARENWLDGYPQEGQSPYLRTSYRGTSTEVYEPRSHDGLSAASGRRQAPPDRGHTVATSGDQSPPEVLDPGDLVNPLDWDFSAKPAPPRWMWDGILEEGTVNMLSGRWSSAKSLLSAGLTAAAVTGEQEFLGYALKPGPVVYLDAENTAATAMARLRSMGVQNRHKPRLHYYPKDRRPRVGDLKWQLALEMVLDRIDPALLVIDGAVSATTVKDPTDVGQVDALFAALGELVAGRRVAVLMLHHERKPQNGERGDAGYAQHGTVYWQNLSDATYAVEKRAGETEHTDVGTVRTTTVALQGTKDPRNGVPPELPHAAIIGTFDRDGALLATKFRRSDDPGIAALVQALALAGEPLSWSKLAERAGMSKDSGRFQELVATAKRSGAICQDGKRQPYYLPEQEETQ